MLSDRTLSALGALSMLAAMGTACDNPVAPAPRQPPPPPAPTIVSRASLAIEDPFVILRPSGIRDEYAIEVRFLLKETGGDSGATIEQIGLSDQRGGGEVIGGSCTRGLRVLPGGVLDTYYTDESVKALSYCGPYLGSVGAPTPNLLVDVSVTFLDDDGRRGWADAQASVR